MSSRSPMELLGTAEDRLSELRTLLETVASNIDGARFDPSTGAPANEAGLTVANLALVADELGELLRLVGCLCAPETAGPPTTTNKAQPCPLVWVIYEEGWRLLDPFGFWHAHIWPEADGAWRWRLAPGYDDGQSRAAEPSAAAERGAAKAAERALAHHGWTDACLPSGISVATPLVGSDTTRN